MNIVCSWQSCDNDQIYNQFYIIFSNLSNDSYNFIIVTFNNTQQSFLNPGFVKMKLLVATRSATLAMARVSALLAAQRELARTQQRDANLDLEVQALAKVLVIQYKPDLVFFCVCPCIQWISKQSWRLFVFVFCVGWGRTKEMIHLWQNFVTSWPIVCERLISDLDASPLFSKSTATSPTRFVQCIRCRKDKILKPQSRRQVTNSVRHLHLQRCRTKEVVAFSFSDFGRWVVSFAYTSIRFCTQTLEYITAALDIDKCVSDIQSAMRVIIRYPLIFR